MKKVSLFVIGALVMAAPALAATMIGRVKGISGDTIQMAGSAPEEQGPLELVTGPKTRLIGFTSPSELHVGDKISVQADRSNGVWRADEVEKMGPSATVVSGAEPSFMGGGTGTQPTVLGSSGAAPAAQTRASQQGNPDLE